MTKPHHHIPFAKYARGEELIEKKKSEKLNLTHSKCKILLLHMQKQGDISIIFFRENHSQLCSYELNPHSGHSIGQCQKYNFALHNQFWGEPRFLVSFLWISVSSLHSGLPL